MAGETTCRLPIGCRCWMLRPADSIIGPVCTDFEPGAGTLVAQPVCWRCEHVEACHPGHEADPNEPEVVVPTACRCWMLWQGDVRAEAAICTDFEADVFATIAGHAMCVNCKHLEACHSALARAS